MSRLNPITVLVTASGAFSSPSVIDCLKNNYEKRKIRVVTADKKNQSIMEYKSDKFSLLPQGGSKNYISELIKLCKKEKIDVVIPCSGSEVFAISKNFNLLQSFNIYSTVPNFETIKKTSNKAVIYELLTKNTISVPDFLLVQNKYQFKKALKTLGYPRYPVCIKPSRYTSTGGGRGVRILRKKNAIDDIILNHKPDFPEIDYKTSLRLFERKDSELIISEYLPGVEWDVYILATNGMIIGAAPILRQRAEQGFGFESVVKKNKNLITICKKIIKTLNFSYNAEIQFRMSRNGKPKIVEINPRVAGQISLPAAAGLNLLYLSVKIALNEKLPKKLNYDKTRMIRYWKELYVKDNKKFEY